MQRKIDLRGLRIKAVRNRRNIGGCSGVLAYVGMNLTSWVTGRGEYLVLENI